MYFSPTTHGEDVRRLEAGRFVVFESTYTPATSLPRHYHDVAALMFATRGSFVETTSTRRFDCAAFDVVVRPPGEAHTDRYGAQQTSCVIANVPAAVFPSLGRAAELFERPALLPRSDASLPVRRLAAELAMRDDVSGLVVEGLLLELIGRAGRPSAVAPRWLERARDFLHAHWSRRVSLSEVAAAAGVHPATLARGFRPHVGCSPGEYLRRLRIEHAKEALLGSQRSIADIALEAGFYDQSHFTMVFRRHVGMTPAAFRADRPKPRAIS
ncbi:MAG TPA: AraC family transcriptional regulator [Thermoanaerobaculia bacterium]